MNQIKYQLSVTLKKRYWWHPNVNNVIKYLILINYLNLNLKEVLIIYLLSFYFFQ